ncbi:MAG: hypothetical protein RLZZ165_931, partial [Bacteroidota bacterium]
FIQHKVSIHAIGDNVPYLSRPKPFVSLS